ncbi:membrane protease YdiL (CAAX protease family) [Arthrobacter sp. CAN_A212]|uniref:hypothetical protein n=1 Tax=unclassified Arthrobacter TaxID=235627 RepID=UPI0018C9BCBD|nr:hypothetical protein [Arthrobacter sp. CAN_C5]MBP2215622.1 membrane protease YdiL (CAAX protease family) [Arthrobacter sp. CAN_C5]
MARPPRVARPPLPWTLKLAVIVWLVVAVLFLVAAGSFLGSAQLQDQDRAGLVGLGVVLGVLALLQFFLVFRLRRGRRSARELLTTIGIIVGLPVLLRGTPGLSVVAVVMLLAIVPLWLPPSAEWFATVDPKPENKWVRLVRRTLSPFRR